MPSAANLGCVIMLRNMGPEISGIADGGKECCRAHFATDSHVEGRDRPRRGHIRDAMLCRDDTALALCLAAMRGGRSLAPCAEAV